jgi:hypothetical protein
MAATWRSTTGLGDVLVAARKRDVTLDELRRQALGPLTRALSAMRRWGRDGASGRIGDVRSLAVTFEPAAGVAFYVRVQTGPGDPLLVEAVSGAQSAPVRAWLSSDGRRALRALGYRPGGTARDFQKAWTADTTATARALAGEMLQVLFDVYGYRGRQSLRLRRESSARHEAGRVFTAVSSDDVRKMAAAMGVSLEPPDTSGLPPRLRRRASRRLLRAADPFVFYVEMCAPDRRSKELFNGIGFRAAFAGTSQVTDTRLVTLAGEIPFSRLERDPDGDVLVCFDLALTGASEAYFHRALATWLWILSRVTDRLRGTLNPDRSSRILARLAEPEREPEADGDEEFGRATRRTKVVVH